ncbi:MAG: TRAP transporter large permease [Sphaerochaetaceae bacterium]|jgi:tripartite ATP-independent transporter DctM subunit|nr:TRAP transporter large permease [Sphaerochaetaceae bacterium]
MGSIVWTVMIILLVIGLPIGFALMALSIILLTISGTSTPFAITQKTVTSLESFTMLAIPFFMMAGATMSETDVSKKIFQFARNLVRHLRGGMAHVNILTSMILAGTSGSAVADVTGVGKLEMEAMMDAGMEKDFSAATTAASSCLAPIIPPSMSMIIYASISGVSIGRMLIGGLIPGIIIGLGMMVFAYLYSKKHNYPIQPRVKMRELAKSFTSAIPALMLPIIILGGILTGAFTATEAAAIGAFYAILLGLFLYRNLNLKSLFKVLGNTAFLAATTFCILYASSVFGLVLTQNQIPQKISEFFIGLSDQVWIIVLSVNVMLLLLGTLMDCTPILLILSGTLAILATKIGMNPVQFGVMVVLNVTIGLITPPVGMILFVTQKVAGISTKQMFKSVWPFIGIMLIGLLLTAFVPALTTWLPNIFFD